MLKNLILAIALLVSVQTFAKTIELNDQNTMSLNGQVDGHSMQGLMIKLQELNKIKTEEPIYLVVNSPGGSIYDGFDFLRFAETSRRKIHTVTLFAASMGFQIVEALGDRYVTSYSTLMSHKASGGFRGEFPGQLDSRYAHVLSHLIEQDAQVVKRTNGKQTAESYAQLIQNEYWANGSKAVNDGFADEIVNVECSDSLEGSREQVVDLGLFAVNVEYSNCPLITQPLSIQVARGADYVYANKIDVVVEFKKVLNVKKANY